MSLLEHKLLLNEGKYFPSKTTKLPHDFSTASPTLSSLCHIFFLEFMDNTIIYFSHSSPKAEQTKQEGGSN